MEPPLQPPLGRPRSLRTVGYELLVLSATILFLELALIRWAGAQVRVTAYFPNLILIGSFLGLGLGCLRVGRRSLEAAWLPGLLLLAVGYIGLSRIVFTQASTAEHLWLLYHDLPSNAPVVTNVWLPVVACFLLAVVAFVPPGQMVADRLREFQHQGRGLRGYCWDLGGSLLGTALFAVAAFVRLSPLHWFAFAILTSAWLHRRSRRGLLLHLACGALLLALVHRSDRAEIYSPYYALSVIRGDVGSQILANGSLHQVPLDLTLGGPKAEIAAGYHHPYTATTHRPRRALVLGAGSGNDVATLLQQGAEHVDAVEIDPVIIELGREVHPNRPYDSPRVRVFNTDARAFLNESRERYDTIVFGTLDSMTRLSALSNVRLDNFVYTKDCFAAAQRRLTDDGALILYFMASHAGIKLRIFAMLTDVFGRPPMLHDGNYQLFNIIFMTGPAFKAGDYIPFGLSVAEIRRFQLPDDDWPYLYLEGRSLSSFYLTIIAWIVALSLIGVLAASPALRQGLTTPSKTTDGPMFLFGLAFLLLETRAVTAMNLLWGGTWLTSAIVIGAILLMVLLGTLCFARAPLSLRVSIVGISLSLLVLYFLPSQWLLTMNVPGRLILSVLAVGAPVFFASTGFASIYSSRGDVGVAFGWNLLGAVAGGLVEFTSMLLGLKALLLLALTAYLIAFALERRRSAALEVAATKSASGRSPLDHAAERTA